MSARVLVVDDDADVLAAIQLVLATDPHDPPTVDTARSGAEALDRLAENDYALVVADFRMPGMDGVDLLQEVRRRAPATVRALLTGFHELDIALAAVERASVHYYLQKPWENAELRTVVREALARYEATEDPGPE